MDCFRWARKEVGTAPFPKDEEYQKLKVEAYNQEEGSESEVDLYTTDDGEAMNEESSEDENHQEDEELEEEFSEQKSELEESVSPETNWWDDYGPDSE